MINMDFSETPENLCYRIAHNMLTDIDDITSCIDEAIRTVANSKHDCSPLLAARIVRNFAFQKFMSAYTVHDDKAYCVNTTSIIDELSMVTAYSSENVDENIIALQLSDILDKYIRTLTVAQQTICIRRYFFADTIEAIANANRISEDNVKSALLKFNKGLSKLIYDNGYIVKKETLFQCFTDIGDELIDIENKVSISSDNPIDNKSNLNLKLKERITKRGVSRYIPIIAGILVVILISICLMFILDEDNEPDATGIPQMEARFQHIFDTDSQNNSVVKIDELVKYEKINFAYAEQIVLTTDNFRLTYINYKLTDSGMLPYCIGTELTDFAYANRSFYTLLGHDAIQYLIMAEDNTYSLYIVNEVTYMHPLEKEPFRIVLNEIYDIQEAADLSKISCYNYDDFSYIYVEDENEIEVIFSMINNMSSTYANVNADIQNGLYSHSKLMDNSVRLTFTAANGESFDIMYNYSKQHFYQFSGLICDGTIYSEISDEAHAILDSILYLPEPETIPTYAVIDPDTWNINIKVTAASATSFVINFVHPYEIFTVDLETDYMYELEKFVDNNWAKMDLILEERLQDEYKNLTISIPKDKPLYVTMNFYDFYGELEPGLYRLNKTIYNKDIGNEAENSENIGYTFSTEFEIKSFIE